MQQALYSALLLHAEYPQNHAVSLKLLKSLLNSTRDNVDERTKLTTYVHALASGDMVTHSDNA